MDQQIFAPSVEDSRLAKQIYSEFHGKLGDQEIAGQFNLAHISAILTTAKPRTVLEIGAGIGTITKLLLVHPNRPETIVATEDNDFCIGQLQANLGPELFSKIVLVKSLDELLKQNLSYDFVISDGGFVKKEQFTGSTTQTVFFTEGSRGIHRQLLSEHLADLGLTYSERHYRQPGIRLVPRKQKEKKRLLNIPRYKIKARKGCWIGEATPA